MVTRSVDWDAVELAVRDRIARPLERSRRDMLWKAHQRDLVRYSEIVTRCKRETMTDERRRRNCPNCGRWMQCDQDLCTNCQPDEPEESDDQ